MILSASRRTDIPSYYSEWFRNRLKAGYVLTRNPMNSKQVSRIELSPEVIDCIVFWTKDPLPMLDKLTQIDAMGYHYYFQFTLTTYGKEIEHNLRDKKDIIKTFQTLSNIIGKDRVIWRYDPILINDDVTAQYHQENFSKLCRELKGYTQTCMISFIDIYTKLSKSVNGKVLRSATEEEIERLSNSFSEIGNEYGIKLKACCEPYDLSRFDIGKVACVDRELVERLCGHAIEAKPDKNQRTGCGCVQSVDIGVYNTCKHGCIYCYANHSNVSIDKNFYRHDPNSDILIGSVGTEEKVKLRK